MWAGAIAGALFWAALLAISLLGENISVFPPEGAGGYAALTLSAFGAASAALFLVGLSIKVEDWEVRTASGPVIHNPLSRTVIGAAVLPAFFAVAVLCWVCWLLVSGGSSAERCRSGDMAACRNLCGDRGADIRAKDRACDAICAAGDGAICVELARSLAGEDLDRSHRIDLARALDCYESGCRLGVADACKEGALLVEFKGKEIEEECRATRGVDKDSWAYTQSRYAAACPDGDFVFAVDPVRTPEVASSGNSVRSRSGNSVRSGSDEEVE